MNINSCSDICYHQSELTFECNWRGKNTFDATVIPLFLLLLLQSLFPLSVDSLSRQTAAQPQQLHRRGGASSAHPSSPLLWWWVPWLWPGPSKAGPASNLTSEWTRSTCLPTTAHPPAGAGPALLGHRMGSSKRGRWAGEDVRGTAHEMMGMETVYLVDNGFFNIWTNNYFCLPRCY